MEWTPARIRLLRATGLCQSQDGFAKALGFAKRTVGNAERGTHPPSLSLRRALDEALESAVSGGFSVTDHSIIFSTDWDIMVIGRSITEAMQPAVEANHLFHLVHGLKEINDS